jgi:hypothetical protein
MKFGIYLVIVSWLLVIFPSGCARTVTPLVTYGEQVKVEVTLRGDMDVAANRYFLVLSSDPHYAVPLPPPDMREETPEFLEPGDTPLIGTVEAYYANFYSTWSGYVLLGPGGYSLVEGPFAVAGSATRETFSPVGAISNRITFTFDLKKVFAVAPDAIYFDFVAVPWLEGLEKIPVDHLPSLNNYIARVAGSIREIADGEDPALDASLDIVRCRVEIQ